MFPFRFARSGGFTTAALSVPEPVVQMISQAAFKAKRLVEKSHMNQDEIKEILETRYMNS